MAWEYSEKTKRLFMDAVHGKPGSHLGEIEDPDGLGEHGSIVCGDAMRFTFRVKRHPTDPTQDVITMARYLTFGCTSAIAASEALCALIEEKGYTPIEALKIQNKDIVEYLEGLPKQKIHCSVMGAEALNSAVFNWAQKRGVDLERLGIDVHVEEEQEGRIVCKCFSLTEPYLRRKIQELNLRTIPQLTEATNPGGGRRARHPAPGGPPPRPPQRWGHTGPRLKVLPTMPQPGEAVAATTGPPLSPYQFSKKVERAMEEYVRPLLQKDGGDMEIVDIKDTLIYGRLKGACAGCQKANQTLQLMVEKTLKEMVDQRIKVIEV